MSETNNKKKNPAIACGDVKTNENGEILMDQAKYGPSQNEINQLAGMEIKVEGYEIVLDQKSGKLLRIKDNRTINEIIDDRRRRKLTEAIKGNNKNNEIGR